MSGSQTRQIAIRLSVEQAEVVRAALQQVGQQGDAALRQVERGTQQAGAGMAGLRTQTQEAGQSTGRLGQIAGQAGFQIQDFAGQVAAGQSALVAFGQQGSQLLGVFGTGGAIAGALLSVGVIVAQLATNFGSVEERAKRAREEIDRLTATQTRLDQLSRTLTDLAATPGEAAGAAFRRPREAALSEAAPVLSSLQAQLEEFDRRIQQLTRDIRDAPTLLQGSDQDPFAVQELLGRQRDGLQVERDRTQRRLDEINAGVERVQGQLRGFVTGETFGPEPPPNERGGGGGGRAPAARAGVNPPASRDALFRSTENASERRDRELRETAALANELDQLGALNEEAIEALLRRGEQIDETYRRATQSTSQLNNVGRDLGLTFSSAFEDAILRGQRFSQVLQGIAQDLARIVIRRTVTEPLGQAVTGLVGSLTGSFFGGGAAAAQTATLGEAPRGVITQEPLPVLTRATGGPVWPGQPFLVGERGPEFFVPERAGTVLPSGMAPAGGGGGGLTYAPTITVDARGSQLSGPEITAIIRAASDNARRELLDAIRRDPAMARAVRGG